MSRPRPATVVSWLLGLLLATACSPAEPKQSSEEPPTPGTTATPSAPTGFAPEDYRYELLRSCRCAFTVPVTIRVRDGEVVSATAAEDGGRGIEKGDPAPDTHRLTLEDLIALAEEAESGDVTWPDGQEWPDRVRVDPSEAAVDDQVTYTIRRVRIR